jgi:hypothetical protein
MMELFQLSQRTRVDKIVPKNAFDAYTNSKQKKLFANLISRITWVHKLSPETVNLGAGEINEIQIFKIELKVKGEIQVLLNIIDKAIPYIIIFIVEYGQEIYLSTSAKHLNPVNADNAVIEYTFTSPWFLIEEQKYHLRLKTGLDAVYHHFCIQLSNRARFPSNSLHELVQIKQQHDLFEKEIDQLKTSIKNCKQYKRKVDLNLELRRKVLELNELVS